MPAEAPAVASVIRSWEARQDPLDDVLHRLGDLPVLVIQANDDEIAPASLGHRLHAWIPGAQIVMIKECGHEPAIEATQIFSAQLTQFL